MKLTKKPKIRSMKAIKAEVWGLCRSICQVRDSKRDGGVDCYTCPAKRLEGQNKQLGHGHPKGACGVTMAYDLRLLRWQCYNCNINGGGKGAIFKMNLDRDLGKKKADALILEAQASKGKPVNARDYLTDLIFNYKRKLMSGVTKLLKSTSEV